ncbi:prolactin-7D1-like isoform X2 [Alexandromys fortis]|uniref:prolactin-7D1-like isoform X2 n=1 Tax=Alexandromys fortis TaxID=100897 RepID=UPI002152371A|nr:prolactin-7D1-like isoform X2 [Microtus fortis]
MLLPSTKPCFCSADQKCFQTNATKGTLLLILVLNLLLWENVASLPVNVRGTGNGQVYLQDLFNHAIRLSYNISELNREMRKMFFVSDFSSNKFLKFMLELNKEEENMPKMLDSCHTPPINTPKTIQESRKLALEDFLIIILNLMGTWKEPLHYQVTKLSGMPGANETLMSTAKNIEAQSKELLELTKWILNMVHPGIEHEDYAEWSDLKSLQAADEETGLSALFKLSFCLGIDTYMVDLNLKYLICVFVGGNTCSFSRFRYDPYDPFF